MDILTWEELDRKEEIIPVWISAFGSTFTLRQTQELIRLDPRLNRSAVGLCAVENGHVIGFVGVMELTTRNIDGVVEPVGGIWGVSTIPSHAKRGVSTALMNEVHQHFREKSYRFSFLTTRRTIIAYHLYLKLGYEDVMEFPSAYRILPKKKAQKRTRIEAKTNWGIVHEIYDKYTAKKTGFVVRGIGDFQMQQKLASIANESEERILVRDEGYTFFGGSGASLRIDELVPNDEVEIDGLIEEIEKQAQEAVYDRMVASSRLLAAYRLRGYMTQDKSHGVLMAKSLAKGVTVRETYSDRFYMTSLDLF